jgi:hypothetical protein
VFAGTEVKGTVLSYGNDQIPMTEKVDQYATDLRAERDKLRAEVLAIKPADTVQIITEDGEVVEAEDNTPIPANLPIVYDGMSATFKPNTPAPAKAAAIQVWVDAHETTPVFLGDLFLQFYRENQIKYEDMAAQFNLKPGTVKNYSSWANRVPPAHRIKGMSVTIWQEAASIRDPEEQRQFIIDAVNGNYTKKELRAMKEGDDPEDGVSDDEEVHKEKCPTCGTMVRAELLG